MQNADIFVQSSKNHGVVVMLLNINTNTHVAAKRPTSRLSSFGLDERKLQDILFRSLDRLFPDDELILLMQSRHWQEEPDLMAIDKEGNLFIFELKAWEFKPRKSSSSTPLWTDVWGDEIPGAG